MDVLTVQEKEIAIIKVHDEDYISLTDMLQAKDGGFFISDWLKNRNTIEYLGIWKTVHNAKFNYGEFATITTKATAPNLLDGFIGSGEPFFPSETFINSFLKTIRSRYYITKNDILF